MDLREQLDRIMRTSLDAMLEGHRPPPVALTLGPAWSVDWDELRLEPTWQDVTDHVDAAARAAAEDLAVHLGQALGPVLSLLADLADRYQDECPGADVAALIGAHRPAPRLRDVSASPGHPPGIEPNRPPQRSRAGLTPQRPA